MSNQPAPVTIDARKVKTIEPDTPEMEAFLSAGYQGMTVETANLIIKERKADPNSWPHSELMKAKAFLEAYHAKPRAINTKPGWKRQQEA